MFVYLNAPAPIFSRPSFKITSSRFLQPENALSPISFTVPGIVIDLMFVYLNASAPIFSRPSFKTTFLMFLQPENALSPISFTEPAIVTDRITLLKKARLPISVIFLPWYSLGIVILESFPMNFVIFQVFDLVSSNLNFLFKFDESSSFVGFSGLGSGLFSSGFESSSLVGISGLGSGLFWSGFESSLFSFEFCFTLWSQEIAANGSIVVNAEILLNISHILLFFYSSYFFPLLYLIIIFYISI